MFNYCAPIFLILFVSLNSQAQLSYGASAALHRYDQVLSFKVLKPYEFGGFGVDLGLGVERSLQGALAPAVGLFWIDAISKCANEKLQPFYSLRYQFDAQKSTFWDLHQGVYAGLGLAFGPKYAWGVTFFAGLTMETLSGLHLKPNPVFLNPQLQLHYFLFRA